MVDFLFLEFNKKLKPPWKYFKGYYNKTAAKFRHTVIQCEQKYAVM